MLVFIDESGFPIPTDSCLRPVLCAVALPKEMCRTLTAVVFGLKKSLYGIPTDPTKLVELHGHKFLSRQTFERAAAGVEPAQKAVKLLDGIMDACENVFTTMKVFAVIMERPSFIPSYPDKFLAKEYTCLTQRVNQLMEHGRPENMATLIFDERDLKGDMKRAFAFGQYFFTSPQGKNCRRVLDTPLFVSSQTCSGLQVADIFARSLRLYKEKSLDRRGPEDEFEKAIVRYAEMAYRKTVHFTHPVSHEYLEGIFDMPVSAFPKPTVKAASA